MKYSGTSWLVIDEDTDLEDLFKDNDAEKEKNRDNWMFPDGDDGQYIEDDNFVNPW